MGPRCEDAQQQFMSWIMQMKGMKGILVTQSAKGKAAAAFISQTYQAVTNDYK